ncbi:MAG: lipid-A-disaccharide synthase [Bacteroidaceae bacterium]|nr:lipid-A-disaccharide synthase [Bacteroidaceae bacterium]
MKYYFIAGEASGDLHAQHLMEAVRQHDSQAEVRYWYRPDLAYMGFVPVVMHLSEILRGIRECKADIAAFEPDRLILVDYPGFNLKIASWFHANCKKQGAKTVYYIPPKIWAWKEGRIAQIRKYVDQVLSILPFEVEWYQEKYAYKVDYVGNPTLDEIDVFKNSLSDEEVCQWKESLGIANQPIVALMPGSRRQEIEKNLPLMLRAANSVRGKHKYVIASAPSIPGEFYNEILDRVIPSDDHATRDHLILAPCNGSRNSFILLHCAKAALVTSGTATLETAIMNVPQIVCYAMSHGKVVSMLRRLLLKVPYVSLVNLIAGYEVVPELVAGDMTQERLNECLRSVLQDETYVEKQLSGYALMMKRLGTPGAPINAARKIVSK